MSEHYQTRTEHTRSLEDAEKYKALETLQELGLLIPYSDVETYHGRVGGADDLSWGVDPTFANGANDSGNNNVNARATLYAASSDVAREFARARSGAYLESRVNQEYQKQIDAYNFDEREDWLKRVNDEQMRHWRELPAKQREHANPRIYKPSDLSVRWVAGDEIDRLKQDDPQRYQSIRRRAASDLSVSVHDMIADDTDAMVLDNSFKVMNLSDRDKLRYRKAIQEVLPGISDGAPLDFEDKDSLAAFRGVYEKGRYATYISVTDADEIARRAKISAATAQELAGAINAMKIIQLGDPVYVTRLLLDSKQSQITREIQSYKDADFKESPINLDYVERWLRESHIVGLKHRINSATIRRNVAAVSLFDLQKVDTKEAVANKQHATNRRLGSLAAGMEDVTRLDQPLLHLLEDAHAKPRALVEAAKKVGGFKSTYEADAGNWEGYTLEEHTETALRNFDENYADDLPVEMLAPMRLMLLAHDIGKPAAVANHDKHNQSQYNVRYADEFFTTLGIDGKLKALMVAVIGRGGGLSFDINVKNGGEQAQKAMDSFSRKTLEYYFGNKQITQNQIDGFQDMCEMLLVCDGGAYTSMAVTKRANGKGTYRNAASFNSSFEKPTGLGKRDLRLRKSK